MSHPLQIETPTDNFELPAATSFKRRWQALDEVGNPINLTGAYVRCQWRETKESSVVVGEAPCYVVNGPQGIVELDADEVASNPGVAGFYFDVVAISPIVGTLRIVEGFSVVSGAVTR